MDILNSALGNKEQREGSFAAPVACLMCISLFTGIHVCACACISMHNVCACINMHVCYVHVQVGMYVMCLSVLPCMNDVHVCINHM